MERGFRMVYLDYAATAPMSDEAIRMYAEVATTYYGNASSLHEAGWYAAQILQLTREQIASILSISSDGIYFTGSGTEGNLIAILSIVLGQKKRKIITTMAEHTSVHAAMNTLKRWGYEVIKLPLMSCGQINLDELEMAITEDTALISVQHVNAEIGVIQPIEEICEIAKKYQIPVHTDCVQSFGKVPLHDIAKIVDSLTISAHKIGGPKGMGAIYIHPKRIIEPLFPGVTHEKGMRGGTVDIPSVAAFSAAMNQLFTEQDLLKLTQLRQHMLVELHTLPIEVIESSKEQYPGIIGMMAKGMEGQLMMLELSEKGFYISTGSACDVEQDEGTKTVLAMGYTPSQARQFFRVSLHPKNTLGEIGEFVEEMGNIIKKHEFSMNK